MTHVRFIVPRSSSDEFTFAIVEADVQPPDLVQEDAFVEALSLALTVWIRTEEGKLAWENSSKDYNVGDLSTDIDNDPKSPLSVALAKQGIFNLKIETFVQDGGFTSNWTYDTVLPVEDD